MPDDQMKVWQSLAFGGVDPNAGGNARQAAPGRLVRGENVRVLSDGSLMWCRDQFRIKSPGVNVLSLFEYKSSATNRLLAFCADGGLYQLSTNWPAATHRQWDFGHELFPNASWIAPTTSGPSWGTPNTSGVLDTNTEGCHALVQYNDNLYIALDSARMLRWDGTSLIPVGLLGPFSGPGGGGTAEDFTSTSSPWTETDLDDYLTVTSDTVTAAIVATTSSNTCYLTRAVDPLGDFTFTFEAQIDSMDDATNVQLITAYKPGVAWGWVKVRRSGSTYYIDGPVPQVGDLGAPAEVTPGVPFYVRWVMEGTQSRLYVYGESDYSDNPQIVTTNGVQTAGAETLYVMYPGASPNGNFSGYLKDLVIEGAAQGTGFIEAGSRKYVATFVAVDSDGVEVWESMPSAASPPFVSTGNGAFNLSDIPLYTGDAYGLTYYRKLYRSLNNGPYYYLATIEDNTSTTFNDTFSDLTLGETFPYDYAVPPWCKDMSFGNDRAFFFRVTQTSESYTRGLYYDPAAPFTANLDNTVFYSELGKPWYCSIFNQFKVGDAAPVVGGCFWYDRQLIFKTNGVYLWTGYDDNSFNLQHLDARGACAYRAWCSGSQGVMWASHDGLMFYDGSKVTMIASYTDGQLTRPRFDDGEYPKMAFSHGRYYFLSGDDLWWFDAQTAMFGCDTMGPVGDLGIQAFQLGDGQAHVLCGRTWDSSTSGVQEITVLHTGQEFAGYKTEGTSTSAYFAPVDIIFAPIVPEPDQIAQAVEMWMDATWTDDGNEAEIYWSTDGTTWTLAGTAPQGNNKVVFRQDVQGAPLFFRLLASYAKDFHLHGAKVLLNFKQPRGYA